MIRNIQNALVIQCDTTDLQTAAHIEFYLRQGRLFLTYTPQVVDEHTMLVTVPQADAMQLRAAPVRLQFAYMDAGGNPRASEIVQLPVGDFLKEAGYDPV